MIEKLKNFIFCVLSIIFLCAYCMSFQTYIPDNAIIYVDIKNKEYYGEPTAEYYMNYRNKKLVKTRLSKIKNDNSYKPNEESKNNGDFVSEERGLIGHLLEKFGILPDTTRWNKDGTWRY